MNPTYAAAATWHTRWRAIADGSDDEDAAAVGQVARILVDQLDDVIARWERLFDLAFKAARDAA